ncbi:MAG: TRAP transporter large permease [Spirochaetales bacterium]|nr:TRAP transporter large permease [Spirochaetales bacterium]
MGVALLVAGWLFLTFLGLPVAVSLITSCITFMLFEGYGIPFVVQRMADNLNSFPLLAVPLFIFAGQLFNSAGISTKLFNFTKKLIGHIPGGLGHVNVLVSVFFSGMSGSALADSGGLGLIEIKAMRDAGFDDEFSGCVTSASSIIGPIIPPSITMVMYGVLTNTSTGKLFLGGIVPGLLLAFSLMVMVYVLSVKNNYPVSPKSTWKEIWFSYKESFWALLTPLIIIAGIFSGLFSPTEAAAITVLYAIAIDLLVYKELTLKKFISDLGETVKMSASIGLLVAAVGLFGYIISRERVPQIVTEFILSYVDSQLGFFFISTILILVLGAFIESMAILLMVVPILAPIAASFGIDPIHYGVIIVLNLMISTLTPPMGVSLFVVSKVGDIPFFNLARSIIKWLIPIYIALIVLVLVPEIVTFIPNLSGL